MPFEVPWGVWGTAVAVFAAVGALVAVAVRLRLRMRVVTVRGPSMEPTLREGDRLVVRRARLDAVHSGQLVVVANPQEDHEGRWMVKRAVAVPGEAVPETLRSAVPDAVVPDGRFLVLGDNPAVSADSRRLGYLEAGRLLGVVMRRLATGDSAEPGGDRGLAEPGPRLGPARAVDSAPSPGRER